MFILKMLALRVPFSAEGFKRPTTWYWWYLVWTIPDSGAPEMPASDIFLLDSCNLFSQL